MTRRASRQWVGVFLIGLALVALALLLRISGHIGASQATVIPGAVLVAIAGHHLTRDTVR